MMRKLCQITILPDGNVLSVPSGELLSDALRREGLLTGAFCGGQGKCGKCAVTVNGTRQLACRTSVTEDLTVSLGNTGIRVLTESDAIPPGSPVRSGYLLAFDIGTTTVVGSLMNPHGQELAVEGRINPQTSYGADVVTRIRSASGGTLPEQSRLIRDCLGELSFSLCRRAKIHPTDVGTVCLVGNPAMQQIFFGLPTDNLITIPFRPAITEPLVTEASEYLPELPGAALLTLPDISGYVGADTVGCLLSSRMAEEEKLTLLVDIGTNGEMVLGCRDRLVSCATAAGPALEGANIRFGMRAADGAIDRVRFTDRRLHCHVIGEGHALGICGSGLIDAAAAALELGLIDRRGRILIGDRLPLCDEVFLTQEDLRELQAAKGAIAAGICMLAEQYGTDLYRIERVFLAGAFSSFLDPDSACGIGLLPVVLRDRIIGIGNAALTGAKLAAADRESFLATRCLADMTEPVELAALPRFQRSFAENMYFPMKK